MKLERPLFTLVVILALFAAGHTAAAQSADLKMLDRVAACAGKMIGNGAADFSNGDERALDDAAELAYAGYGGFVFSHKFSEADLKLADTIMQSNVDGIIALFNADTFDADGYEDLLKCNRLVATTILKQSDVIREKAQILSSIRIPALERLKRLLNATK